MDGTVLVAGVSRAHDDAIVAAIRAMGRAADAVPVPRLDDLAIGRALLPRGHPISTMGLVGALVSRLAMGPRLRAPIVYVVYAGNAPGLASDYRVALQRAGHDDVRVVAWGPDVAAWTEIHTALGLRTPNAVHALLDAVVTADVAVRAHGSRPHRQGSHQHPVRVRLCGDAFCATTDGPLGADVVARLEQLGARVERPAVASWLAMLAHRAGWTEGVSEILARFAQRARERGLHDVILDPPTAVDRAIVERLGRTCELPIGAHCMLGAYLSAARDRSADLVIALDPFLCTVSTAITAGTAHQVARAGGPRFLALELSGDADTHVASRLELAVDLAREDLS